MNIPKHQGNIPAEAVSELQSLDYLEIVEALKQRPATGHADASSLSIAPVGLDLMPDRDPTRESEGGLREVREAAPTAVGSNPKRRGRRVGLILGTIAGCMLIAVAAGIARVGHASSAPSPAAGPETQLAAATPEPLTGNVVPSPTPATAAVNETPAPASRDESSVGTVRLGAGLSPRRVLFDGKTASSASALVSCGTHQIKIGHRRAHSVDVPCGGEIVVSR
jgi:hypothetical protein